MLWIRLPQKKSYQKWLSPFILVNQGSTKGVYGGYICQMRQFNLLLCSSCQELKKKPRSDVLI